MKGSDIIDRFSSFIFDLDNTIYLETEYLFPAYEKIAQRISSLYEIPRGDVEKFLVSNFIKNGRYNLFDRLISKYSLKNSELGDMLNVLRINELSEKIQPFEWFKSFANAINERNKNIFVLTNGNVIQQKNKVQSIDWGELNILDIVFAEQIEPKPSSAGVIHIMTKHDLSREEIVLIGDSEFDEICAFNAGITFIHVDEMKKIHEVT